MSGLVRKHRGGLKPGQFKEFRTNVDGDIIKGYFVSCPKCGLLVTIGGKPNHNAMTQRIVSEDKLTVEPDIQCPHACKAKFRIRDGEVEIVNG